MGKRKTYREYWKRMLNYDYENEYNIYKYLCGGMRHKWQEKKIAEERRFKTYSDWKEYVMTCYKTSDLNELKEFNRYLKRGRRIEKSAKGIPNGIILPLCVALITTIATDASWRNIFGESLEVIRSFIDMYGISLIAGIISIIGGIIFIVCIILIVLVILVPIFFLIMKVLNTAISEGEIEAFYEDYIEIIDEVIAQKETASKKNETP
ncbi:MAG: hypothetical protein K2I22_12240 [Lachnospiraceae bacterium]|nr:hypothetical protein [Lachnospiraceae bacterium]